MTPSTSQLIRALSDECYGYWPARVPATPDELRRMAQRLTRIVEQVSLMERAAQREEQRVMALPAGITCLAEVRRIRDAGH